MDQELRRRIRLALEQSWSKHTCHSYDASVPSRNQCAQTAIIIHERFGGVIRKTIVDGYIEHWFNVIDGEIMDFTADQFNYGSRIVNTNYIVSDGQRLTN